MLSEHFPSEAEGIRGFVQEMLDINAEVETYGQKGVVFKLVFPIQYPKMWNVRNKTLADLLNAHVKDPELQSVLAALWGYFGLPPSRLSGFYYANATGGYLRNGSFSFKRRSQDLSSTLAEEIEISGGQILYDTTVEKIRVENGAVQGVTLSDGENLKARAVVSNASALTTFLQMLPRAAVPADYLKKLESFRPSISCFIVWLGLNRAISRQIKGFSTHVSSGEGPETEETWVLKPFICPLIARFSPSQTIKHEILG